MEREGKKIPLFIEELGAHGKKKKPGLNRPREKVRLI